MFGEEKCPNCGFEDYDVDKYWDDFDEDSGVRWWQCTCPKCHKHFDIVYEYKCTGITVGQRELTSFLKFRCNTSKFSS